MQETYAHPRWIVVAAPDAAAAFALEKRLAHLDAAAIERHGRWTVEVEDTGDVLEELTASVRHWLRVRGLAETTLTVEGVSRLVTLGGPPERTSDDEPVLLHEP